MFLWGALGVWRGLLGNIVGTVCEGGGAGSENLEEGVGVLGLVVVVGGGVVDRLQVTDKGRRLLGLVGYDIHVNTSQEEALGDLKRVLGRLLLFNISRKVDGLLDAASLAAIILDILTSDLSGFRGGSLVTISVLECLIVVGNDSMVLWLWGHVAALQEERAEEDVVPLELPIILDEKAVEVRKEENDSEQRDSTANTEDRAKNESSAGVLDSSGTLPDDKHYRN